MSFVTPRKASLALVEKVCVKIHTQHHVEVTIVLYIHLTVVGVW